MKALTIKDSGILWWLATLSMSKDKKRWYCPGDLCSFSLNVFWNLVGLLALCAAASSVIFCVGSYWAEILHYNSATHSLIFTGDFSLQKKMGYLSAFPPFARVGAIICTVFTIVCFFISGLIGIVLFLMYLSRLSGWIVSHIENGIKSLCCSNKPKNDWEITPGKFTNFVNTVYLMYDSWSKKFCIPVKVERNFKK